MSRDAVRHWRAERISALALIPLTLWFVVLILSHLGADRAQIQGWLGRPIPALLAAALVIVTFYHSALGVRVVIEDYVHAPARLRALLSLNVIASWLLALLALGAIATLVVAG